MDSAYDERITMNQQYENDLFHTYYNYYIERNERLNNMMERINDAERLRNLLHQEFEIPDIEVPFIERIEFQLPRINFLEEELQEEEQKEEREEQIDEFLTLRTEEMMIETEICSICLENISYGCRLNCQHCFHPNCIKRWLIKTNTCPMCRSVV